MSTSTTITEFADALAAALRAAGMEVKNEAVRTHAGVSCYVRAFAVRGRFWARFGVRISDHSVGVRRFHHDPDVQHFLGPSAGVKDIDRLVALARSCVAELDAKCARRDP